MFDGEKKAPGSGDEKGSGENVVQVEELGFSCEVEERWTHGGH